MRLPVSFLLQLDDLFSNRNEQLRRFLIDYICRFSNRHKKVSSLLITDLEWWVFYHHFTFIKSLRVLETIYKNYAFKTKNIYIRTKFYCMFFLRRKACFNPTKYEAVSMINFLNIYIYNYKIYIHLSMKVDVQNQVKKQK